VLHRHLNKLALRYRIGRLVSPHTQVPRSSPYVGPLSPPLT
jgi:hypothetical protein